MEWRRGPCLACYAQARCAATQPTSSSPSVGHLTGGQRVKVLVESPGQNVQGSATWYRIDGGRYAGGWVHSSLIHRIAQPQPNTTPPPEGSGRRPLDRGRP